MTRDEIHKLAPLPWHRRGWDIFDADGHKVSLSYQYVMDAIVAAVNAHFGEGNDKQMRIDNLPQWKPTIAVDKQ